MKVKEKVIGESARNLGVIPLATELVENSLERNPVVTFIGRLGGLLLRLLPRRKAVHRPHRHCRHARTTPPRSSHDGAMTALSGPNQLRTVIEESTKQARTRYEQCTNKPRSRQCRRRLGLVSGIVDRGQRGLAVIAREGGMSHE